MGRQHVIPKTADRGGDAGTRRPLRLFCDERHRRNTIGHHQYYCFLWVSNKYTIKSFKKSIHTYCFCIVYLSLCQQNYIRTIYLPKKNTLILLGPKSYLKQNSKYSRRRKCRKKCLITNIYTCTIQILV